MGWYDYGARFYEPALARWMAVDPLAEKYAPWSPYNYVLGNPVRLIDPDGRDPVSSLQEMWDNTTSSSTWTNNEDGTFSGGENSSCPPPCPRDKTVVSQYRLQVNNKNDGFKPSDGGAGVTAVSAFFSYRKYTQYNKYLKIWRGKNEKLYYGLKGRGPNGHTGSRGFAKTRAGGVGVLGSVFGVLSLGFTEAEYQYNMSQNPGPNLERYLGEKRNMDQSFNGVGFLGQFGASASFGYNLGYLIEDICNCNIQLNPYTMDFTPIEQTLTEYDNLGIDLYKK